MSDERQTWRDFMLAALPDGALAPADGRAFLGLLVADMRAHVMAGQMPTPELIRTWRALLYGDDYDAGDFVMYEARQ